MVIFYLCCAFPNPFLLLLFLTNVTGSRAEGYLEFHGLFGERILSTLYGKWPGWPARDIVYNKETGRISHAAFSFDYEGKWVPTEWCSRGEKRKYLIYNENRINLKRFTSTSLASLREQCFKAQILTQEQQEDIQRDLRSIKVALETKGIEVFLGQRTFLDSIRYGQLAFHEKEIELQINSTEYARARDILQAEVSHPTSDLLLTSVNRLSVGLACGPGEEPAPNPSTPVLGPIGRRKVLSTCLMNVTFLNMSRELAHNPSRQSFGYRSLYGVLFQVLNSEEAKLLTPFCPTRSFSLVDSGDLINILDHNLWLRRRKLLCSRIALPCHLLDDIQPRSYTFNYSRHSMELFLTKQNSTCRWRSTFVKSLDPHYVYHNEDESIPGLTGVTFY